MQLGCFSPSFLQCSWGKKATTLLYWNNCKLLTADVNRWGIIVMPTISLYKKPARSISSFNLAQKSSLCNNFLSRLPPLLCIINVTYSIYYYHSHHHFIIIFLKVLYAVEMTFKDYNIYRNVSNWARQAFWNRNKACANFVICHNFLAKKGGLYISSCHFKWKT